MLVLNLRNQLVGLKVAPTQVTKLTLTLWQAINLRNLFSVNKMQESTLIILKFLKMCSSSKDSNMTRILLTIPNTLTTFAWTLLTFKTSNSINSNVWVPNLIILRATSSKLIKLSWEPRCPIKANRISRRWLRTLGKQFRISKCPNLSTKTLHMRSINNTLLYLTNNLLCLAPELRRILTAVLTTITSNSNNNNQSLSTNSLMCSRSCLKLLIMGILIALALAKSR